MAYLNMFKELKDIISIKTKYDAKAIQTNHRFENYDNWKAFTNEAQQQMWATKERISEPKDRSIEIIQFEEKNRKKEELSKLIWDL